MCVPEVLDVAPYRLAIRARPTLTDPRARGLLVDPPETIVTGGLDDVRPTVDDVQDAAARAYY